MRQPCVIGDAVNTDSFLDSSTSIINFVMQFHDTDHVAPLDERLELSSLGVGVAVFRVLVRECTIVLRALLRFVPTVG